MMPGFPDILPECRSKAPFRLYIDAAVSTEAAAFFCMLFQKDF